MADPRFFRNQGPFSLTVLAAKLGIQPPSGATGNVFDLAGLEGAGPEHLAFFSGAREQREAFQRSRAGFCLVPAGDATSAPDSMVRLEVPSVAHAWALAAATFYPESGQALWPNETIHPDAKLAEDVAVGPGVVIGAAAEIGSGTRIGPGAAIGPGVAIGRNCDIGAHVTITHAYVGDEVMILPGAQIGQPGFGFASSAAGHIKTPQLGRVILQDRVEIGANTTIDRGALGDTVIGEGSKIDNLVMIGHNVRIGRNCFVIAQVGIAGSSEMGDFVVLAGQAGVGDHTKIGDRARFAAKTGVPSNTIYEGGIDYGGMPAKPVREWVRELHALKIMLKRQEKEKK
ncbi:MAG: UDP-3-O-(3-hydroxymyristoyl)glucosamine N-acyltransferase, partial [Alphaproteobacteria bacterium]|nr:UDP-3-O-(3-hydroxymyristoyl)glucosamine N-acyltransferase [Alphaproteobacteria bacterium]